MASSGVQQFEVVTKHRGDVAAVAVLGELDLATAPLLRERLSRVRAREVDLDLAGVAFVDATGLRELLVAAGEWRRRQRVVRCVKCSEPVRRLLALTGTGAQLHDS